MTLHFIHVGKTGGTAIKRALRSGDLAYWQEKNALKKPDTPYGRIALHHHSFWVGDVAPDDFFFFCVRDPISRFLSGFYSRLNKGQPSYYFEWSDEERRAFETFPTPQRLATALAGDDAEERALAQWTMRNVRHLGFMVRPVGTPWQLRARLGQIVYIAKQETLSSDWEHLKSMLGLPHEVELPSDAVRSHRRDPSLDTTLDDVAVQALRDWYRRDYRLMRYCDQLRAWRGWDADPAEREERVERLRRQAMRLHGVPAVLPRPPLRLRRGARFVRPLVRRLGR